LDGLTGKLIFENRHLEGKDFSTILEKSLAVPVAATSYGRFGKEFGANDVE
jgi:hypothetical protein